MSDVRILSDQEMRRKCHIGEGARCCAYLGSGIEGIQCFWLQPGVRSAIQALLRAGTMNARSGPCENPNDSFSEAVEA